MCLGSIPRVTAKLLKKENMINTTRLYDILQDKIYRMVNDDNLVLICPYLNFTRANSIEVVFSSETYGWFCSDVKNPVLVNLVNQDPFEAGTHEVCGSFVIDYNDIIDEAAFIERLNSYIDVKSKEAIKDYLSDFSIRYLHKLSIEQQLNIAANADELDKELGQLIHKYANKDEFEKKVFADCDLWESGKLGCDIQFARKASKGTTKRLTINSIKSK